MHSKHSFIQEILHNHYKQHHTMQHPKRWKEYQEASKEEKKTFFDEVIPVKQTLHTYFGAQQVCQRFLVNATVVNVIIGDMLWDPEDIDGETHAKMMHPFLDFADAVKELEEGKGVDRYCIVIKNPAQFSLAIGYLKASCSFWQTSCVMMMTKEKTGSSTHRSTSYLDICIRLHLNHASIVNLHVLVIPVFDWHTGLVIFEIASKALDVLCKLWRDVVIGVLVPF